MTALYVTFLLLFLGVLTQSHPSREPRNVPDSLLPVESEMTDEEVERYCTTKLSWLRPHQQKKCKGYPRRILKPIMATIQRGVQMALTECDNHFSDHRWNCSGLNTAQFFQDKGILKTDTRESAYVYAITAVGVAYEVTDQCASGKTEICGCDTRIRGAGSFKNETWQWGGCSANIRYGDDVSRDFMDPDPAPKDVRNLLVRHNNEAGRKALRESMTKGCKCHGLSGSCAVKICWRKMKPFPTIASLLRVEFDRSQRVRPNSSKTKLLVKNSREKRTKRRKRKRSQPSGTDLVFMKKSPNFCKPDPNLSILGISGRLCNKSSPRKDSCREMCCGNGYNTIERSAQVKCECQFIWCCKVRCEVCGKDWFEFRCK